MNCFKAAGKDGIPGELYRSLNEEPLKALHQVLSNIWEEEEMPPDLSDTTIITLY